ncbi:uncharacterized protein LOC113493583 [Trichoplusia ni]|uniref:Uncharacterized protein LOC113493583 n=1 Tax=Trichoplusia ni TaxID=7111 RepID=A0A7E5VGN5_TRINI|nr:uncharacterized protein LOC113493583 [Trichoplusia ni]
MLLQSIYLSCVLNIITCDPFKINHEDYDNIKEGEKAAFFELPCMLVGGTCARGFACPPGTRIGERGLCPEQQEYGMECCRPLSVDRRCRSRGGLCQQKSKKCPRNLRITDANDCRRTEMCCYKNLEEND